MDTMMDAAKANAIGASNDLSQEWQKEFRQFGICQGSTLFCSSPTKAAIHVGSGTPHTQPRSNPIYLDILGRPTRSGLSNQHYEVENGCAKYWRMRWRDSCGWSWMRRRHSRARSGGCGASAASESRTGEMRRRHN